MTPINTKDSSQYAAASVVVVTSNGTSSVERTRPSLPVNRIDPCIE